MEILINSTKKIPHKAKGLRGKIAEMNKDKVSEFLRLHNLSVSSSLEENCKKVAKQYEILRQKFDAKKKTGLTPQRFANFQDSEQYDELLEANFDDYEAQIGFSGWESNFQDFKNFNEGLGAEFEDFKVGNILKAVKGVAQKAGSAIKSAAKKGGGVLKGIVESQTGLSLGSKEGEITQVPESQQVIYSQTPLSTVRSNVVAVGAGEWLNADKAKAIDELIKKGEKDKERAEIKAQLVSIGVDPRRFTNFVGEDFDVQKAKTAISDILSGVVEGEKAKAKNEATPKIIFLVVGALVIGYFIAKKA